MRLLLSCAMFTIMAMCLIFTYFVYENKVAMLISGAEGTLVSGKAFGVAVGEDAQQATRRLENGGWTSSKAAGDLPFCDFHTFSQGSEEHIFVDRGWTRGTL